MIELAGREAHILDMARHYYCEEMNRAITNEDIERCEEMQRERDGTIKKLIAFTAQRTEEDLKKLASQNYNETKRKAVGRGAKEAVAELERSYESAKRYLGEVSGNVMIFSGSENKDLRQHIEGARQSSTIIRGNVILNITIVGEIPPEQVRKIINGLNPSGTS